LARRLARTIRTEDQVRKLLHFMMVSANGFYERGLAADDWRNIDWHNVDDEFTAFAVEQLEAADTLVFGRVTYEGMASYWPTPEAIADSPATAEKMNSLPKIVVSTTLDRADWNNTRVIKGDLREAFSKLKREPGKDIFVLGSSDLTVSLADLGLVDEYRLMINPVALGSGKPVLQGLKGDLRLRLLEARTFANGNVLLRYEPGRESQS
jgi:dihydrofolate reductase